MCSKELSCDKTLLCFVIRLLSKSHINTTAVGKKFGDSRNISLCEIYISGQFSMIANNMGKLNCVSSRFGKLLSTICKFGLKVTVKMQIHQNTQGTCINDNGDIK